MLLEDAAGEGLAEAVRGDEAAAAGLSAPHELGGLLPPVEHEVGNVMFLWLLAFRSRFST
jgi:hypothetical protein